jgi:hypothetical protein
MVRGLTLLTGNRRHLVPLVVGTGLVATGAACFTAIFLAGTPYSTRWLFFIAAAVSTLLKFAGAAIAVTGVGIFGFYFIRDNGRSARRGESSVPAKAWRGPGPRKAARIFAVGISALTLSVLVSLILPRMP